MTVQSNLHQSSARRRSVRAVTARFSLIAIVVSLCFGGVGHAAVCNLDVDADGRVAGTTDGLLVLRYMLGIRGNALTANALGSGAARSAAADIEAYLAAPCAQAGWVGQGSGQLNDTGITFAGSYPSGNSSGCTGDVVAQQDCSKGRDANLALNNPADGAAGFSFTKISNAGAVLPSTAALGAAAGDWACTYDNVTGLMWEVKTTSGRRSQVHTYTSFNSDPTSNGGVPGSSSGGTCFDAGQCDTEKYTQLINIVGLCGHNDWRMPHVKELEGIANLGRATASIPIDPIFFPNTPSALFWTGSPAGNIVSVWEVNAHGLAGLAIPSNDFRVRLVRAGL